MPVGGEIEDGSICSNRDVFHPPHKRSWDATYLKEFNGASNACLTSQSTEGMADQDGEIYVDPKLYINSLPLELLDEIFRFLSVPALDAARLVSTGWYARIMSSPHFLSHALGEKLDTPMSPLLATFDETATLVATRRHCDCWRARFRQHRLQLSLAASDSDSNCNEIISATYYSKENFFLIENRKFSTSRDSRSASIPISRKLNIYRMSTDDPGQFVCQLDLPLFEGQMNVQGIQELNFGIRWRITIEADGTLSAYDITVRRGWQGGENPYQTTTVGPTIQEVHPGLEGTTIPFASHEGYQILSRVPPDGLDFDEISKKNVRFPCYEAFSEGSRPQPEDFAYFEPIMGDSISYHVARNVESGEIQLLRYDQSYIQTQLNQEPLIGPEDVHVYDMERCSEYEPASLAIATLSPPTQGDYVFINLAVASTIVNNSKGTPVVRVAVIWQSKYHRNYDRSLLYLYELPWSLAKKEASHIGGLAGKRISSVPTNFGGMHPKHTFSSPRSGPEDSDGIDIAALGGMHFSSRPTVPDAWTSQWCKLHIWGPCSQETNTQPCTSLELKTFDFSFMSPERLKASDIPYPVAHGVVSEVEETPRRTMMSRRIENCCCVLHDEVWHVELPEIDPPAPSPAPASPPPLPPRSALLRLLTPRPKCGKGVESPAPVPRRNEGTISRVYSLGQRAAMARQEEWIQRWIVGLKVEGKEDWEVLSQWNYASWTRRGLLPCPVGWQKAWKVWAEEFGVAVE